MIEVLIRFSSLVTDWPELTEIDINPLLVTADRAGCSHALATCVAEFVAITLRVMSRAFIGVVHVD